MNRIAGLFISSIVLFIMIFSYTISLADVNEEVENIFNIMKMYEKSIYNGKGKFIYELKRSNDSIKYLESIIDKESNLLIAKGIDPKNINITSHLLYHINCIIEGEKIRCDIEIIDPGAGSQGSEIWIYNGEDTKYFYKKVGMKKGFVLPGCHIMKGYQFENEYNFLTMSYLSSYKNGIHYKISEIIENAYLQKNSDYFDLSIIGKAFQDSLDCTVISFIENNNGKHISHKLWLAPSYSYMPIKHVIDDGKILVQIQYRKYDNDIVFPSKIDEYLFSDSGSLIIDHTLISLENNWEFNKMIPNDQFQMNLPSGIPIYDEYTDKHYISK